MWKSLSRSSAKKRKNCKTEGALKRQRDCDQSERQRKICAAETQPESQSPQFLTPRDERVA